MPTANIKVNYHCHSWHSDGKFTPEQLVQNLHKEGVTHFALTDHDTIEGVIEAQKVADEYNMHCYTGIEITACLDPEEYEYCHILGYDFDYALMDKALDEFYNGTKRDLRATHQVTHLSPRRAIEAIHKSKGIAILAHPFDIICFMKYRISEERSLKLIRSMLDVGIDGIEVYYQGFSEEQIAYLCDIADRHNLIKGIGTDYHRAVHRTHFDRKIVLGNTLHEVLLERRL